MRRRDERPRLGVDIGHLDAMILGYPGRSRRSASRWAAPGRPSALLIAQDSPLEQHFVARPAALIDHPKHAAIAPRNPTLLRQHLAAAARDGRSVAARDGGGGGAEPSGAAGAWREWSGAAQAAVRARELELQEDAPRPPARRPPPGLAPRHRPQGRPA